MKPYQEQALEAFVAAGGSFMPIHNRFAPTPARPSPFYAAAVLTSARFCSLLLSMWGYPIGIHPDGADPLKWEKSAHSSNVPGVLMRIRLFLKPNLG